MNRELQDKLFEEFPVFFRERHLDRTQSCMSGYGICIRDEWFEPFRDFCKAVQKINATLPEDDVIIAAQIKEKWYRITVYTNHSFGSELDSTFSEETKEAYRKVHSALVEACPPEPQAHVKAKARMKDENH